MAFIAYTKKVVLALLILAVGFVATTQSASAAHGDSANYSHEFSSTNLYSNDGELAYHFTGLVAAEDYLWLLQGIDEDGGPLAALETKSFSGATSVTITWKGNEGAFDRGDGTLYTGPVRVIDNFGNSFGPHFLAPGCSQNFLWECQETFCWTDTCTAVNGPTDRVVVGDRANLQDENADGYFHTYNNPNVYLTLLGEYTLLHYRCPPGGGACGTDEYRFHKLNDPTVTHRFEIQDFVDYNTDINNSVLTPWFPYQSFVILNTNGETLPFINHTQNDNAFNNVGAGDNPHEAVFTYGAYDYTHTDVAGVFVSDGESVMLVGKEHGSEWSIQSPQISFEAGHIMFVELETDTEEIWDSSYNDHELVDSVAGVLDSDDYIYVKRRSDSFTISGVPSDEETLTWTITPSDSNATVKTLAEMRFDIEFVYEILSTLPAGNRVEKVLQGFGMDTPLGRTLGLLAIMGALMIFAASQGAKGFIPFALIFVMSGGAWMALGLGDPLTLIIFGIAAVVLLYMMVKAPAESGGGM